MIPEEKQARDAALSRWNEAFIDAPRPVYILPGRRRLILGPLVVPLSPMRRKLLAVAESPLLLGGAVRRVDIRRALWLLSPDYAVGCSRWRQLRWDLRHWRLDYAAAIDGIRALFDQAFADAPLASSDAKGATAPPEDMDAALVMAMHPWPDTLTLSIPYARLWLYWSIRSGSGRGGARQPSFGPGDAERAEWLRKRNEEKRHGKH